MNLEDISRDAHANALSKGFHSNKDGTPKELDIPTTIALLHSEISEAFEEYRKNPDPSHVYYVTDRHGQQKPEGFLIEIADVIIRIADIMGKLECCPKLIQAIEVKMAYNTTRPFMHGGKTC